jgi:glycosyltransferase involved in cell wall biosynthesis
MVAAEAASAGVPPLVADHSGLAEVAAGIAAEYPAAARELTSFPSGDADVLRERLRALLALPSAERKELGLAARRAVERNWSWVRVAERLLEPLLSG